MERIVERLLLLAKSEQQGFAFEEIDLEAFLSDLFIRWSEVAPRAWRLDVDLAGRLVVDPEALRDALDALLENAVKYTDPGDSIELAAHADGAGGVVIEVSDSGVGICPHALPRIFDLGARDGPRTADDAAGEPAGRACKLRRRDPEADVQGDVADGPHSLHERRQCRGELRSCAGRAGDGDEVEPAVRGVRGGANSLLGRRRGDELNPPQPRLLLDRKVDKDEARRAPLPGIRREAVVAVG